MEYLLDTNILLIYNRNSDQGERIERDYRIFEDGNDLLICVVTVGEIWSLYHQLGVGNRRRSDMMERFEMLTELDISDDLVIDYYEEIDAYSQGRHRTLKSDFTAINMGKNDLWIAATAAAFDLTLVTTDGDFDHLDGVFLKLIRIPLVEYQMS